ncbi:hypothetical protein [Lichenicoccus roseus]|uniref:Uncharacterized protein n=1 Tax=Lichenicoccus roseus TaxID=2683649 RepID=A0A5R9J162_9PROT|nr:hypothetical protein [Lichenicoccus roseus]TLU70583.1 hypothetical protein FE263_21090 [Lichenicoccus roseus]
MTYDFTDAELLTLIESEAPAALPAITSNRLDPHSIPGYSAALDAGFAADEVAMRLRAQLGEAHAAIRNLEARRAELVEKAKSGTKLKAHEAGDAVRAIENAQADATVIEEALRSAEVDCETCRRHMANVLTQQLNRNLAQLRADELKAGEKVALATRDHGFIVNRAAIITTALNISRSEQRQLTLEELCSLLGIQG